MNWKCIRLELARTTDFPEGSASRAYLLRLPLGEDGHIDERAIAAEPNQATVRRFWPSQPDMIGHVIRTPNGWALSYEAGEADDGTVFHVETHPIRLGEHLAVTEPDGRTLLFRVASVSEALRPVRRQDALRPVRARSVQEVHAA
jgi:hypothetical protein